MDRNSWQEWRKTLPTSVPLWGPGGFRTLVLDCLSPPGKLCKEPSLYKFHRNLGLTPVGGQAWAVPWGPFCGQETWLRTVFVPNGAGSTPLCSSGYTCPALIPVDAHLWGSHIISPP